MVSNSELRANARKQLGGNIFSSPWLYMLVACLIVSAIEGATSAFVVGFILAGPLEYGLVKVLVKQVKGQQLADFTDLFKGFTEDFAGTLILWLLEYVFIFLWSLLFIIPGIIKSYSYALAFYIKNDDVKKDWKTCIDESRSLMDGYKWKLFCLDLSFLGWYILGALCFGIGTLFVVPYHQMARANFYEARVAEKVTSVN